MIEFIAFGRKIRFDFTFFAALAVLLVLNGNGYILWGFYACILHELGHLIVMEKAGAQVGGILFYGAGIKISTSGQLPFRSEMLVLLSGSAMNFLTFGIFFALWGKTSGGLALFSVINLCIGLFNLLPLPCFDGGKLVELFLERFLPIERLPAARFLTKLICGAVIVSVIALSLLSKNTNLSLYATLAYFLILEIIS